jgi:hypothetical protein
LNNPNLDIQPGTKETPSEPGLEEAPEQPQAEVLPPPAEVPQEEEPKKPQPMVIEKPPVKGPQTQVAPPAPAQPPIERGVTIQEEDLRGPIIDISEAKRLQDEITGEK